MGSPEANLGIALLEMSFIVFVVYIVFIGVVGRLLGWIGVKALAAGKGKVYFGILAVLAGLAAIVSCLKYSIADVGLAGAALCPLILVAALPISNYLLERTNERKS